MAEAKLTLENVDAGSVVALLDDATSFVQAGGSHAVQDGEDLDPTRRKKTARTSQPRQNGRRRDSHLSVFQVLHEVVVHQRSLDQLAGPARKTRQHALDPVATFVGGVVWPCLGNPTPG